MRLSKLQKHILEKCRSCKSALPADFYDFYEKNSKSRKLIADTIHKSLDSLVAGDMLTALGRQTAKKWYIHKIRLTAAGKKRAAEIIKNKQRKLPLK